MGFDDDIFDTGLVLGLGLISSTDNQKSRKQKDATKVDPLIGEVASTSLGFEPSLVLSLNNVAKDEYSGHQDSGGASSNSNGGSVKRERDFGSEETTEAERVVEDEDDDGSNRKKLRLTKSQSALLEESFKLHTTLNPKHKQDLARELNLRPRQVEVWFQNRRARTKLKQTEADCEFMKKCCETLKDENTRLHKELQELKALKLAAQPLYMQLPAATITICPSCEGIRGGGGKISSESDFNMAHKPHLCGSFTNPSATCN